MSGSHSMMLAFASDLARAELIALFDLLRFGRFRLVMRCLSLGNCLSSQGRYVLSRNPSLVRLFNRLNDLKRSCKSSAGFYRAYCQAHSEDWRVDSALSCTRWSRLLTELRLIVRRASSYSYHRLFWLLLFRPFSWQTYFWSFTLLLILLLILAVISRSALHLLLLNLRLILSHSLARLFLTWSPPCHRLDYSLLILTFGWLSRSAHCPLCSLSLQIWSRFSVVF